MTPEQIERRIKDEYRKHPNLDWAKIAAIKIHSELKYGWGNSKNDECIIHSVDMSGLCFKCGKQTY